jgi:hypothetical protein
MALAALALAGCVHVDGKRFEGPSGELLADVTCSDPEIMADCHIKARKLCGGDYAVDDKQSAQTYGEPKSERTAGTVAIRGLIVRCQEGAMSAAEQADPSAHTDGGESTVPRPQHRNPGTGWWHL